VSDCSTPKGYRQIFNEKMRPERRGATGERASIGLLNESLTHQGPRRWGEDPPWGGGASELSRSICSRPASAER